MAMSAGRRSVPHIRAFFTCWEVSMARDHNHNLVRTGTSWPADDIEYADFVDIGEPSGAACHDAERPSARSRPGSADRVRKTNRRILMVSGVLGVILTLAVVLAPAPANESTSSNADASGSALPKMIVTDEHGAVLKPTRLKASKDTSAAASPSANDLIDQCYHLDSCGVAQVLHTHVLQAGQGWRLIEATLRYGSVKVPSSADRDDAAIAWDADRPTTLAALCSPTAPTLARPNGSGYVAEVFDFGGNGVPGAQQNSANIYQALCHGFYAHELASRASALGYAPLPDGGPGEYQIENLDALLPHP